MSTTLLQRARANAGSRQASAAVSVSHVSKAFKLPHQQYHTLKERVLHPFRSSTFDVLQAVDDVSVEVSPGEFFGIIGRNGSGKSTLLKCIAGIYGIDDGSLQVQGRLSPFIELGVGFNLDLTARDNIVINAIMLGLTRKQAKQRFGQIIEFAGLEEFLDLKLKNYSSGMLVRLAFSVAIQVEAEILLIDEVLAVGDVNFQGKCFDEFERLKREGRTILFVTHDMGAVERFCNRAMLLERGRMVAIGEPAEIARKYNLLNIGQTAHQPPELDSAEHLGALPRRVGIIDAWFENPRGERIASIAHGEPCRICMEVRFNDNLADPIFGATLRNQIGGTVFATTTDVSHGATGHFRSGQTVTVRLSFENCLAASRYTLTPSVAEKGSRDALELREDIASLLIHGGPVTGGVAHLQHSFEIDAQ
ncbi:MAG: ABC transporter ATP-binding protein [Solirubrobacteraceae bacterium]